MIKQGLRFMLTLYAITTTIERNYAIDRWTRPCGYTRWVTSNNETASSIIEEMSDKLSVAKLWTGKLQTDYELLRLNNPNFVRILQNMTHAGFPTSVSYNQNATDLVQMVGSFKQDYGHLSVLAVFLEQAKVDDIAYDYEEFTFTFNQIEDMLYSALCSLHNLIKKLGSSVDSYVTRDVMSEDLRTISKEAILRYSRDFITTKDSYLYFSELLEKFISI